jgi:hypothetical protein
METGPKQNRMGVIGLTRAALMTGGRAKANSHQ